MKEHTLGDVADAKLVHLTTKGRKTGKPHTVEVWFANSGNIVYMSHEGDYTDWMKNIQEDGTVNLETNGIRFEGKARIVSEGESFQRGKHALYLKYYGKADSDVIDDWFSESTIVEISLDK
jgi:deazaflavin-dependent oxidoreductase (nitroreductase family)